MDITLNNVPYPDINPDSNLLWVIRLQYYLYRLLFSDLKKHMRQWKINHDYTYRESGTSSTARR